MVKIAIIIPFTTLNNYCLECIESCLSQTYGNIEIILLPNSKIKLPVKYSSPKIKIIPTRDVTIARKRNIGIKSSADAKFYAFIDSDAYPRQDWLKRAKAGFLQSDKILAVGGPNISPPKEPLLEKVVGNALKSILVSGVRSFRKKIASSRYCIDLPTCNLIINAEALKVVNGFAENLITGEDMNLCNKLINRGGKIFYKNDVIVYHHNRRLFKPFIVQRLVYGYSVYKLLKEKIYLTNLYILFPFLTLLFLVIGGWFSKIDVTFRKLWLSVVISYLILALIESVRYSQKIKEIPLTFIAILIGNIAPGIGTTLDLFGKNLFLYESYKRKTNLICFIG